MPYKGFLHVTDTKPLRILAELVAQLCAVRRSMGHAYETFLCTPDNCP